MSTTKQSMQVVKRLVVVGFVIAALGGGGYFWHKQHRRSAARDALATGKGALAAGQYTKAATDLGRYLTVDPRNVDVLLDYADAQIRRRPQVKGSFQQAINALEIILRDQPAHETAAERLCELYMMAETPADAERIADAWLAADDSASRANARKRLIAARLAQRHFKEADEVAAKWLSDSPDDPGAPLAQIEIAFARDEEKLDAEPLRQMLKTFLDQHPDSVPVAARLAALIVGQANTLETAPSARSEAEQILTDLVTRLPDSVDARLARGRFYLQLLLRHLGAKQDDRQKAIDDYAAVAAMAKVDTDGLLEVALALSQLGEHDQATEAFEAARKREPTRPAVYSFQGQMLLDRADTEAGARFADAVMAAPLGESRFDLLPIVAELYAAAGQASPARKCIEEIRAGSAPAEVLLYLEALVQIAEGKREQAIKNLEDVNRRAPDMARPCLVLARLHQDSPDAARAIEPLRKYISLEQKAGRPGPAVLAQVELARLLERLGQWRELAKAADGIDAYLPNPAIGNLAFVSRVELRARAARMRPEGPDLGQLGELEITAKGLVDASANTVQFHILLARIIAWQGRVDEAVTLLNAVPAEGPDAALCTAARVEMYADAGQYMQAATACEQLLDLSEEAKKPDISSRLAELYAAAGDMEKATELLESRATASSTGAAKAELHLHLARLFLQHDQRERAESVLVHAIHEDPANRDARLILLQVGPTADSSPTRDELIADLRRIEGEEGRYWRLWQAITWLDQQTVPTERARQIESLLNECLEQDPAWSDAGIALARLHEKIGDDEAAMADYQRVLDRQPGNERAMKLMLFVAQRLARWEEVDRLLNRLPANDPDTGPIRLAQALRKGDSGLATSMLEKRIAQRPDDFLAQLQLSSIARASNDSAEAERRLAEAMRIAPDAPEVLAARVQVHVQKSEFEQALLLCNEALKEKPNNPDVYQLRAGVHEAKGDIEQAAADLRSLAGLKGSAERGYLALGRLYFRRNEIDQAISSWHKGLEEGNAPDSYPMRGALAGALLASTDESQQAEGGKILDDLLRERPDDMTLQLMSAERVSRNDPEAARQMFEAILREHPNSTGVYRSLAQIASAQGRQEDALKLVNQGLGIGTPDFDLLMMKANLTSVSAPGIAVASAYDALQLRPDSEPALLTWVSLAVRSGSYDEPIRVLRVFLDRPAHADSIGARLALAHLNILNKDLPAADTLITEAQRLDPEGPGPVQVRLIWHHARQSWEMLAAVARDRLQKHPDDVATPHMAVQLLFEAEDAQPRQDAIALLNRLIALHPKDPIHKFALGSGYYNLGQPAETARLYEQGLELAPDNLNMLNDLAWILCEDLHNPQAALKWGEKAHAMAPDDGHVLDTWGVLQYRLGNLAESVSALEKCLDTNGLAVSTRYSATFHLARSLAGTDPSRSIMLLRQLEADSQAEQIMSRSIREEAKALLESLSSSSQAASQAPQPVAADAL